MRVSSLSSGALLSAREIVVIASPVISAIVLSVGLSDRGAPRLTFGFCRGARSSNVILLCVPDRP
jgi:hypothetical protein